MVSLGRRASLHQVLISKAFSELAKADYFNIATVKYGGKAKKMVVAPNLVTILPKPLGPSHGHPAPTPREPQAMTLGKI